MNNDGESSFHLLIKLIFSEYEREKIDELKVILPCKKDVLMLLSAFKIYRYESIPEVISLEGIDEESLKSKNGYIIDPTKKILLLIKFILEWNKENNCNLPIELVYTLAPSLDKILVSNVHIDYNEYAKKIGDFIELLKEKWSNTLNDLGLLEHKNNYINDTLHENQRVMIVGTGMEASSLIKAVYDLPFGIIVLFNLNFAIKENDWQRLNKKHYQYCLKRILNYLGIDRREVTCLNAACNKIIDNVFDTTADLNATTEHSNDNIEIITCNSKEEEARMIALIAKHNGYDNVLFFTTNELLATRVSCLLKQYNKENYPYITLLLYSIEVLISNWSNITLLALLKHVLVDFGYNRETYDKILSELEIKVLRSFNVSGIEEIVNVVCIHKTLQYQKDILFILSKLREVFKPLLNISYSIHQMIITHLQCVNELTDQNLDDEFIEVFLNASKDIKVACSLELYKKILTIFLKQDFLSIKFSIYYNRTIIVAGFDDAPRLGGSFLTNGVEEEQGYFLYILHNLFCASRVYVTRSANCRKPILLRRLEALTGGGALKYPYLSWLKLLDTPECVVPYTQPIPKPSSDVRRKSLQVISASAVEKLIRDPYSYYAEYILNLKCLKDLNFRPSILEFGILVHSILEKCSCNGPFEKNLLMSIVKREFLSCHFSFSNIWWVRLQSIVKFFMELKNSRNGHVEVEKSFSVPISEGILLTAKCDRIEYLADNLIAIIDYKLGLPPSNDKGFFLQLILQALAAEFITKRKVEELAYWKFDYDQIRIISLKDYKEKIQEFQKILPNFLSSYLSDEVPFIALPYLHRFLRFSSYKHLERVGEWLG